MNLQTIVDALISDTVGASLPRFRPELVLCATIVLLLVAKVLPVTRRIPPFVLALAGALLAFWAAWPAGGVADWPSIERTELFTGMLVYDGMTVFMRLFLTGFAVLFVILARMTGLADRHDGQDFYCLVFGSTVGMCLMASANHLLTIFLGVEMASVPSYVLAGVVLGRRRSSEASLKYAVYGAGTAGVMLYGASLLAGVLGAAHLPTMAQRLSEWDIPAKLAEGEQTLTVMVLALGGLMLGVGLAFKLSAVPFHFWCPDVFGGASAEVNGFLSVASKAAALALLVRVGIGFGFLSESQPTDPQAVATTANATPSDVDDALASAELNSSVAEPFRFASTAASGPNNISPVAMQSESDDQIAEEQAADERDGDRSPLAPVQSFFVIVVAVAAVITCSFGNLAAYGQTNIKRLLAYSTIAHAGYMMMPVAAAVALLAQGDTLGARDAIAALLLYASVYLFMNLGAFAIVAFLRNSILSEEIKDYAGMIRSAPTVAVTMSVIMFSLVGLPPLAGFIGKFRIFQALVDAGGTLMMFLLVVAGLNTAISLVYYLRVAKTLCMDAPPDTARPAALGMLPTSYIVVVALAPVCFFGVFPSPVADMIAHATAGLFG